MSLVSQRKQLGLIKEKTVYMDNGGKGRKEKGNKRDNNQNKTLSHHLVIQVQFPHHHFCNLVIVLLYRSIATSHYNYCKNYSVSINGVGEAQL